MEINDFSISIDEKMFEQHKATAREAAQKENDDTDTNNLLFKDCRLDVDDCDMSGEKFSVWGGLKHNGEEIGWVSIEFTPNLDEVANLLAIYIKKLNKLKTVLEATD